MQDLLTEMLKEAEGEKLRRLANVAAMHKQIANLGKVN